MNKNAKVNILFYGFDRSITQKNVTSHVINIIIFDLLSIPLSVAQLKEYFNKYGFNLNFLFEIQSTQIQLCQIKKLTSFE